jgi:hypothetical protein
VLERLLDVDLVGLTPPAGFYSGPEFARAGVDVAGEQIEVIQLIDLGVAERMPLNADFVPWARAGREGAFKVWLKGPARADTEHHLASRGLRLPPFPIPRDAAPIASLREQQFIEVLMYGEPELVERFGVIVVDG